VLEIEYLGRVLYEDALERQMALVEQRRADNVSDTVLLLEHDPVYTIGRGRDRSSLRNPEALSAPVVEISRGGQATYHGPGQLVGYPILDLKNYGRDLHLYLRALEGVLIDCCNSLGLETGRRDGLTGVWSGERKLASIGVGVRHWISLHGFAINVCGDLGPFEEITPCGITGVEMTSVSQELGREISVEKFATELQPHLERGLLDLGNGVVEED